MGQFSVVSNRTLKNKKGEDAGRLKVLVRTGTTVAETSYKCPECFHEEQLNLEWQRPLVVTCSKCANKIKMEKLKDEIKKEKKKEKAETEKKLMAFKAK
ncbi:MAG: hypothetical protein HY512_03025 [Candidatus Aenigmarchaeota archaeon]|nr:hypothetical protein [Candidatus Aenigmarchaeota archaeon]